MVTLTEAVSFLDQLLRTPQECTDVSNNGLQVEGRGEVRRVVFGVDASRALFEQAIAESADLIVVHHGISWRDNLRYLTKLHASRLRMLFQHGVSLYASHVPLDAHPEVGNNAVIASRLGLSETEAFFCYGGVDIGRHGRLPAPVTLTELVERVNKELQSEARALECRPAEIQHIGIVSGGGADALDACCDLGVECLVTGEFGHEHVHAAMEMGVSLVAAGHYRTEVCGVQTVMRRMAGALDLECMFVDIPTGW